MLKDHAEMVDRAMRRYRHQTVNGRYRRNTLGIPVSRRAWHVKLDVIEADPILLATIALQDLPHDSKSFWVRRRMVAQKLAEQDRAAGGQPEWNCVEWRRCLVCKSVLIGAGAHEYQGKILAGQKTWKYPDGPVCGVECTPKAGSPTKGLR